MSDDDNQHAQSDHSDNPIDTSFARKIYKTNQSCKRAVRKIKEKIEYYINRSLDWLDRHEGAVSGVATVITGLATVAIAVLTYSISADSNRQANIIENQLKIMQLDERPWLSIRNIPAINSPLYVRKDFALVGIDIPLKNVGKSPAANIHIVAALIPMNQISANDILKEQKDHCPDLMPLNVDRSTDANLTLLPNEEGMQIIGAGFNAPMRTGLDNKINADFFIVGCVYYSSFQDKRQHATGFIYHIFTKDFSSMLVEPGGYFMPDRIHLLTVQQGNGSTY